MKMINVRWPFQGRILFFCIALIMGSCTNNSVKVGVKNTFYTDTIRAVVVNKFYNDSNKEYSILYKNSKDGIFEIKGKMVSNLNINDSIQVIFSVDTIKDNSLVFKKVTKFGQSDKMELINIKSSWITN